MSATEKLRAKIAELENRILTKIDPVVAVKDDKAVKLIVSILEEMEQALLRLKCAAPGASPTDIAFATVAREEKLATVQRLKRIFKQPEVERTTIRERIADLRAGIMKAFLDRPVWNTRRLPFSPAEKEESEI